jgi:hypothetical protein
MRFGNASNRNWRLLKIGCLTLDGQFAEIADNQPELLARHCTEAGLIEKAVALWGKAGQRSLARAALLEGTQRLKRALDQIATLPATPDLRREEFKLEVAFANALALTGDLVDGKEHYDRALAIYDVAEHRPVTTRSGRDVGVTLLSSRSSCLWILGYPAAALNDAERALENAREAGQASRRSPTTGQILGATRSDEHGAPLARPEQGAASARNACSGLRVVR